MRTSGILMHITSLPSPYGVGTMASDSETCIISVQDYLNLGGEARMNFPGTTNSNWTWRAKDGMITDALAEKIHHLTTLYARLGTQAEKAEPKKA